jgi:DNA-directed RNA polymerase specialized sigma24 family protein
MAISPETRGAVERLLAADDDTAPLELLRRLRDARAALDADPAPLAAVRTSKADWAEIARAAGIKPAAAKWRWQGTDEEIAARHEAGRKRSARASSVPTDLPGLSVADAARRLGVTVQAVYLRISRGQLRSETVTLEDGRSYKRVLLD